MNIDHYPSVKKVIDCYINQVRINFDYRQYEFSAHKYLYDQLGKLFQLCRSDMIVFLYAYRRLKEKLDI